MNKMVMLLITALLVSGCMKANTKVVLPSQAQPQAIKEVMARVADWQIANPSKHHPADWTQGALYSGFTAWAMMAEDAKYMEWLKSTGQKLDWQPHQRVYHADDHCVGWMYLELYNLFKDPQMLKGIKDRFDFILAHPSQVTLKTGQQKGMDRWWWCDALFMAPPVWVQLGAITGDSRYIDFMNQQWWATTEYLYDKDEHLYFRDDTYFAKREANGKKVFWSRGNGWVFGGLVRVLEYLPQDYPDRPKYVKLYKEMAARLIALQQPDGFWHSSLLDPASYPAPETSGTGFYCYGLAWGINRGILDEKTYLPPVLKAWQGLVSCVNAEGKLGYVQQIGADPRQTSADETEVYGVGAFLYAGSEMYKIAIRSGIQTAVVDVTNPTAQFRDYETICLNWSDVLKKNHSITPDNESVFDLKTNQFLVTQTVDNNADGRVDELLFQSHLAPGQQKVFWVMPLPEGFSKPQTQEVTYGRFVPERYGDFAWENDRIAFRMYSKALEWETVSPGIDVWVKKVRTPMIEHLYKDIKEKKSYHTDHGEGLDCYKVGPTLGCGGLGILAEDKLILSRNFVDWKQLANGPIRIIFELTYDAWDAGGVTVSEVKRISLDRGSNLNRIESRMTCKGARPLALAAGIVTRGGQDTKTLKSDEKWISYWFAPDEINGMTGCGIVFTPDTAVQFKEQNDHLLGIVAQSCGKPFVYYTGACWDKGLDFKTVEDWQAYLSAFAARLANPIHVTFAK